ncbi:inhibitor of Bruton tyrosine kinase-like [Triplophysa rosa]|uniref:inhibitor of Bruton tyrosine kinase-like n=1 Tax=Triplophysa rosa TaxID=992332 RepID=UPI0025462CB8|nr:inhibitor of Bruton tyrosine kinase-like [Triplophysa rosa]
MENEDDQADTSTLPARLEHDVKVFCWRSMGTAAKQCRWAYGRQVFMSDIALSKTSMMFVTQDGEGFSGEWLGQCKKAGDKKDGLELSSHLESGAVYERIRLEKLHYVHRAVSITMDSKGRNFGLLQADPKTSQRILHSTAHPVHPDTSYVISALMCDVQAAGQWRTESRYLEMFIIVVMLFTLYCNVFSLVNVT